MILSNLISDEDVDKRIEVQEVIDGLDHRERAILYLWVVGYTQAEIGHMFGYSQRRISQILQGISKSPLKLHSI